MKIVLAIDSFKGCLSSVEAEEAAAIGVRQAMPDAQAVSVPVSDGGEGMLEMFTAALGGTMVDVQIHDPLMRPIVAQYAVTDDGTTAIIESAKASGLGLLTPEERNPMIASSHGTGELIADALRRGCSRLVIGLGGSATSDGGRGMVEALGVKFDTNGNADASQALFRHRAVTVTVASDVQNPLYGPNGAAHVYAPQKGATPQMVQVLDEQLRHFAHITAQAVGSDLAHEPGAGAAGGMGFALMAYMSAQVVPGADWLLDAVGFDHLLDSASLVITGEGRADRQTLMGKLPWRVLQRALRHHVPTALIAGQVDDLTSLLEAGFTAVECINPSDLPTAHCMLPEVARRHIAQCVTHLLTRRVKQEKIERNHKKGGQKFCGTEK